jgi:hypothetical protein
LEELIAADLDSFLGKDSRAAILLLDDDVLIRVLTHPSKKATRTEELISLMKDVCDKSRRCKVRLGVAMPFDNIGSSRSLRELLRKYNPEDHVMVSAKVLMEFLDLKQRMELLGSTFDQVLLGPFGKVKEKRV